MQLLSELLHGNEAHQTTQALGMLAERVESESALRKFCSGELREMHLLGL